MNNTSFCYLLVNKYICENFADMYLITRKSECKNSLGYKKALSPKDAKKTSISNYRGTDDMDISQVSYVSENSIIINSICIGDEFTMTLARYSRK